MIANARFVSGYFETSVFRFFPHEVHHFIAIRPGFSVDEARFLGVGRGIPVSLLVSTLEPGGTQVSSRIVHGCLGLSLGNDVLFQPAIQPSECRLKPATLERDKVIAYHRISRLALSDVLSISEFVAAPRLLLQSGQTSQAKLPINSH